MLGSRQRRGIARLISILAVLGICALGLVSTAQAGSIRASQRGAGVPYGHRYETWEAVDVPIPASISPSLALRSRSRAAWPLRDRTQSVLRYQTPLGKTGIILRLKVPLKQRKLVKFELRF